VVLTDLTDVRFLNDPFGGMMAEHYLHRGFLFLGDQPENLRQSRWMRERYANHLDLEMLGQVMGYDDIVLNAGFAAGSVRDIKVLVDAMVVGLNATESERTPRDTDMVVFNWAARSLQYALSHSLVHGLPVNTPFGSWVKSHETAWIAHK